MTSRQLDEEAIFHIARDLSNSVKRATYLDQVCAGDQALRERVEALLEVHEKERSFLHPADPELEPTIDAAPIAERVGSTIGRYKLMEQIGEGGMGVVFVAEQQRPLRRKVALKVIKPGMDSKAVIARFEAERQALALMNHPNIAKVFDAGSTDTGRPFFVMELVQGIPVTQYCDDHRLTVGERLELLIQICCAVQHAHQRAIIHRDLKPTNVLVTEQDGTPIPKIIDFGVAKALNQSLTDHTIYTSFQSLVGTPMYASPEQASLSNVDVDTRSDVYSLGVLLYELLTGMTPFDRGTLANAGYLEICRIIKEVEPAKPSTRVSSLGSTAPDISKARRTEPDKLGKMVRGDLDWIVMKAMDKDRARRYESASSLATDLTHFLHHEPVMARPPSRSYRVRKFARRNRTLFTAMILVVVAWFVGFAGITWFAWQANRERQEAQRLLTELQDSVFQSIFHISLLEGKVDAKLLKKAEGRLTTPQFNAVLGLAAFYANQHREAVEHFENAEETPATLAVRTWAYISVADDDAVVRTIEKMKSLPAVTAEDHLMMGQLYSWLRPGTALTHLAAAAQLRDSGAIAEVVRALVIANYGLYSNDLALVREANRTLKSARILYPENRFILEHSIFVAQAAGEVAHRLGENELATSYVSEANNAAARWKQLSSKPSLLRLVLLASEERFEEALEGFEELLEIPSHSVSYYAAIACLAGEEQRALAFLKAMPDCYYKQIGLALLLAQDPARREDVSKIVNEVFRLKRDSDARTWALHALLMAGEDPTTVASQAEPLVDDTIDLLVPMGSIKLLAESRRSATDFLGTIDDPGERNSVEFTAGLQCYASNDIGGAVEHLHNVLEHGSFFHLSLWAKVILHRIETDSAIGDSIGGSFHSSGSSFHFNSH